MNQVIESDIPEQAPLPDANSESPEYFTMGEVVLAMFMTVVTLLFVYGLCYLSRRFCCNSNTNSLLPDELNQNR